MPKLEFKLVRMWSKMAKFESIIANMESKMAKLGFRSTDLGPMA